VINLPDGKMIVDSKVSLTAYENTSTKKTTKIGYLKEHVNSIKRHVEQMGNKIRFIPDRKP
jgi:DNA recombination protein RmuC